MANGVTTNPWEVSYSQIAGAPKGGQRLEDLVQYLFSRIKETGRFDDPDVSGVEGEYTGGMGSGIGSYISNLGNVGSENPLQDLSDMLKGLTVGQGEAYGGLAQGEYGDIEGYNTLGRLLGELDIGNLSKGYSQSMGDISSEIQGQMGGVRKGFLGQQKAGRYAGLGTKSGGGRYGRKQYSSDIYDLTQKQQEMQVSAGENLKEDFNSNLYNWLRMNNPNPTGG